MNKFILSLLMLALGVSIGFSINHFQDAERRANETSAPRDALKRQLLVNHPDALNQMKNEMSMATGVEADSVQQSSNDKAQEGEEHLESKSPDLVLLKILMAIRKEQKALREQIAESNRDIDELSFRVDTHSDSFRPLNTLNQRPRAIEVDEDSPLQKVEESSTSNP